MIVVADTSPPWLEERAAGHPTQTSITELGPGEREAIQLALDLGGLRVLMDESRGRSIAKGSIYRLKVRWGFWNVQPVWG